MLLKIFFFKKYFTFAKLHIDYLYDRSPLLKVFFLK